LDTDCAQLKHQGSTFMSYTTIILKAGALLPSTMDLFSNWDESDSVDSNLARLKGSNVFGKVTRERIKTMLRVMRNRYLFSEEVSNSLAILTKNGVGIAILKPILYFNTFANFTVSGRSSVCSNTFSE